MFTRVVTAAGALLGALIVAAPLGAAPDRGPSLSFRSAPRHVFPGKPATVSVTARPAGVMCALTVRYPGGSVQRLPRARATRGRATWQWEVPATAATGAGSMHVACGRAGQRSRALVVVGNVIPRRISVAQRGFSVRPTGSRGSDVSYGVILQNEAADRAAVDVKLLVNFVDAQNRLFGSASTTVPFIAAGSRYALGEALSFPGAAPIAKLEVVIQVGGWTRQAPPPLSIANLRLTPAEHEPAWAGALEGELINDHPRLILEAARMSAVIFDADGNIIGGANGSTYAALPPGARVFFKLTSAVRAVAYERAHSALVSVEARWTQPPS